MIVSLEAAPRKYLEAGRIRFAYRRLGPDAGTPLILLQHFYSAESTLCGESLHLITIICTSARPRDNHLVQSHSAPNAPRREDNWAHLQKTAFQMASVPE